MGFFVNKHLNGLFVFDKYFTIYMYICSFILLKLRAIYTSKMLPVNSF